MSYAGRMYRRLFTPSLLVIGVGAVAAGMTKAAQQMPGSFGLVSLYSNLPAWIFAGALVVAAPMAAVQIVRVRLWDRGALAACYVCGCLLGAARASHRGLGTTRRCLGCSKVHGTNHRLSPHVVPLAVAVTDTASRPGQERTFVTVRR